MTTVKWRKDERTEGVLKSEGVAFTVETRDTGEFDLKASHLNQARDKALDADVVSQYAAAMRAGAVFPAVVVYPVRSKLVIAGGNHRAAAAIECEQGTILCYVIDIADDEYKVTVLPKMLNLVEGMRPSFASCVQAAVFMVTRHGMSADAASKKMCVSANAVTSMIRSNGVRERVSKTVGTTTLPQTTLASLAQIKNDNVLGRVIPLAQRAGLTMQDIAPIIGAIKEKRTELEQLAVIADLEKKYGVESLQNARPQGARGVIDNTKQTATKRAITQLETVLHGKKTFAQLGITKESEKVILRGRIGKIIQALRQICK